jgi:hypothetical protein
LNPQAFIIVKFGQIQIGSRYIVEAPIHYYSGLKRWWLFNLLSRGCKIELMQLSTLDNSMKLPQPTHFWRALPVLLITLTLLGCAELSPGDPLAQQQSMALQQQQDARAVQAASAANQTAGRRVWFAGFAMSSTSTAFENDMTLVSRRLSEFGGPVLKYEYSNGPQTEKLTYPFATSSTLTVALQDIARHARPDDIVVVFISTHGNREILGVNAAHKTFEPITATQLAAALAPLGNRPTVVILAACFSGAFLPELEGERRIVLTAASGERPSFGCQANSQNTFFTEELFANDFDVSLSLSQLMAQAKVRIARRESALNYPNSRPQMSVGQQMQWLAQRSLKDWFQPGMESAGPAPVDPLSLLTEAGKEAYREYLTKPVPRAFVISSGGGWQTAFGAATPDAPVAADPATRALAQCNRRGLADCKLYAVDNRVVWSGH